MANENKFTQDSPAEASSLDSTLNALLYKLQNTPGEADQIKNECDRIRKTLSFLSAKVDPEKIKKLIPYFDSSFANVKTQLFFLLEALAPKLSDPWIILEELLSTKDENSILNTLDVIKILAKAKQITVDSRIIKFFSDKQDIEDCALCTPEALEKISAVIENKLADTKASKNRPILEIYLNSQDRKFRALAAKLLDLKDVPISEETIVKLLGIKAAKSLSPYLIYTRATHLDLLYLILVSGESPPILESILHCEKICGEYLIREVISKLGWKIVNYGLTVQRYVEVTINGSLPLFISHCEAKIFENSVGAKRISEFYVFTAHGGLPLEAAESNEADKPVICFRSYNLAHANLLQDILDVAPLTAEKVIRILQQMDRIVDDFIKLFSSYSDECSILQEVYGQIKRKVVTELSKETSESHLSAEVTRLVQMFEDPHSLGEVHTVHGLKRYLHQKGLQLGFKLVDQSRSPNQSINLVLATNSRVLSVVKNINFANFEADTQKEFSFSHIPYPIEIVLEGFKRQLLHGLERFPSVNIFCYGNEVHYFVWFRNHPVFIRVDYSPPLQGGMIDLQYFGVSNYEIADQYLP